ncbi:hypothetical protein F5884DRAFT_819004 [Xylogone sp. PMI_703]|nr:hypothetical protein F5884DRAFT_819004 [Xylogone sp. PMI_703]
MGTRKTVLVIGATGAQGIPVVKALTQDGKYAVRAITRDTNSENAQLIASWPNTELFVSKDIYNEQTLRKAFKGVQLAFVNTNGYVLGEKGEIYWGIIIYEIAIESGVEHFIWGSLDYALKKGGWNEKFKCGHYDGKGKVADWLLAQRNPMTTSVLTSGPYMELLFEFLQPKKAPDGTYVFAAPLGTGAVALIHLEDLGSYARWIFDHKSETNGMDLEIATQHVTWSYLASAFTKVTGKKAVYVDLDLDDYFNNHYPAGPKAVDRKIGTMVDKKDNTLMTWRQNFSGFWNIWKHSGDNKGNIRRNYAMLDRILPNRIKTVEEWMKKVEYDGEPRPLLKDWVDGGIAVKGKTAAVKL